MANTFITPSMVARDASIALSNRLLVGNLVTRDKENMFTAAKVGDSVKVTVPPAISDASEFTGTTVASDATETEVDLTLEKHFYKRVDLTSKQKTLELSDFTRLVTVPAICGIQESIDKFFLRNMQVFRKNLAGTIGNRPSTVAHYTAGMKLLNDNKVVQDGRIALIDTTVESSLIQIAQFTSADYGVDGPAALRDGYIGKRFGLTFFRDANLGAFSRSENANDLVGADIVTTVAIGGTEIDIHGITSATGTIYAGTAFTIDGDTTRYIVRKDADIAANATTLLISPALIVEGTAAKELTFEAAGYENIIYHPNSVAGAIVAPTPLAGGNSSVQSFNGVSIRVSMDSSISTLSDTVVYDVFVACRVIQPDGGALVAG
jgi:hypothetical protein